MLVLRGQRWSLLNSLGLIMVQIFPLHPSKLVLLPSLLPIASQRISSSAAHCKPCLRKGTGGDVSIG